MDQKGRSGGTNYTVGGKGKRNFPNGIGGKRTSKCAVGRQGRKSTNLTEKKKTTNGQSEESAPSNEDLLPRLQMVEAINNRRPGGNVVAKKR